MTRLRDGDYVRFRDLLQERVGLYFGEGKRGDLSKHLAAAMTENEVAELGAYYAKLWGAPPEGSLWTNLVDRLTIGETYFFRNPAHFAALREHILPSLIRRRRESGWACPTAASTSGGWGV